MDEARPSSCAYRGCSRPPRRSLTRHSTRRLMLPELFIILVLILVNGFLAGAEIAVVSVRKTRLSALLEEGRGGARALAALRSNPERFLATVQIGITVVGT